MFNREVVEKLAQSTQEYWKISSAWNGRGVGDQEISTSEALCICKQNVIQFDKKRPIVLRSSKLLDELIQGYGGDKHLETEVLSFPSVWEDIEIQAEM